MYLQMNKTIKPSFAKRIGFSFMMMLLTTTTAWAQDAISGLTYNTEGGYYEISDVQDLVDLATYVNGTDNVSIGKTFRQTANIDMSSVNNFDPIGSIGGSKSFKGTYDGGNFTISNLTVSNNYGAIGLFGMIKDATIRNIVLVSPTVGAVNPGGNEVCLGALIGVCDKISGTNTVYNCHVISPTLTVSGTSSGTNNIGAIIGEIYNKTTVTNCYYYSNTTEYAAIGKYDSDATLTNVARVYQLTLNGCTAATADLTVGSVNYCKEGTEVTLTITPAEGYSIGTVKYNDGSDHEITPTNDVYSFTMPASDVTVSATYTFTVVTPQLDSDGNYLIGTAAELYGFAQLVNGGNSTANAKLTADIVVNENVLAANGDANTGDFEQWTPIGNDLYNDKVYSGTFDGQGHTISGLYVSISSANQFGGLIGTADGSVVVKNLGVVDSYFGSSNNHIGSIVGNVSNGSTVTIANVFSTSTVAGDNYIGGLVGGDGSGSVTIINSYFAGKTTSAGWSYGSHHDDLVSGEFVGPNSGTLTVVNTFVLGTSNHGTSATAAQLTDGTVAAALHYYQDALADGSMWGISGGKTDFSGTIDGVSVTTADITLHTFDGDATAYSSKYVVGNTTPLPVNVVRDGYTFFGWYDNANLEGDTVTQISFSETGNKEYWAKFERSHTVSFVLDGGNIYTGEIDHYIEGETTALPSVVTKAGASFEGWYTTADFTGDRYYAIPATATEDMTFYAKWGAAKTTFYLTQGSPEPVNILYEGENIVWLDETTMHGYYINDNQGNIWGSDGTVINVPYTGGESTFGNNGRIFCVAQSGFYVFTLTDKGEGNWFISVYPTVTTSYVDADGTLHENVLAIPLDGSEPKDEHDCVELSAGTYYVGNTNPDGVDASYTCLVFNGPATLILGDGATMSVNQTVSNAEALFVGANAPLTIYGQTLGTGTLTVTNNGGLSGIRSSSDITINGGIIETTGSYGIHSYSNITLNGGTITATGIMAEGTSTRITLGGATVTSSSYSAGSITIVDGMGYVDDTGAVYYGTLWSEAKAAIANKTLTKDMSWTNLKAAFEAGGTQTVTLTNNVIRINSDHIEPTGTVTLDLNGYTIDGGSSQTNPILRVRNGVNLTITDSRTGGNLCNAGINETVFVGEGGTLTLQSGTIHDSSWGVIVDGSFIMTGGTITGGTVSGVYLYGDNATFTMSGGTITGNNAGVNVSSATATFTVSGNVDITGNTTKDVNMYYDYQSSTLNPIHIGGTLASTARIGIYTDCSVGDSEAKAFTVGLKGRGTRENFNLKTSQAIVLVNLEDGEMAVAKPYTLSVPNNVAVNELTEASSNTYTVGYGDYITLTYGGAVPSRQSAHYTVPNGTITYLGNVDAQGRKIAFTMPNANTTITKDNSDKDYIFNGITLKETFSDGASQGLDATFDGTSEVIVDIPNDITVKSVTYNREFKGQTPATVMLPFDYICNGTEGGKFYTFVGVEYDDNNDQWIATMEEEYDPKNRATCLERNKPYLFMPSGSEGAPANMQFPDIPGYVTLNTTGGSNGVHDTGPWRFFGVYHKKVWTEPSNDYGFAATNGRDAADEQDVSVGQFVRFTGNGTKNAFIKPMRCYLSFVGTNNARGMNRAAETEELPQSITVRLVSANGDATDIGTIDTRTGEFIPNGWYDMNGRKLNGKPAVPGIYVNNGKKIVIK